MKAWTGKREGSRPTYRLKDMPQPMPGPEEVLVQRYRKGDPVMAMVHAGCAEYASAHQDLLMPIPSGMSWTDAAAIPVSFLTAHDALITNGRFTSGQSLRIQGVTTGVGLAAVQLARLHGASLIAGTSRSLEKLERVRSLGLQLELLALRRISLIGVTFRSRSLAEHAAVVSSFTRQHASDFASGALRPVVDKVFGFFDLPAAIERATRGEQFGRLVLEL